MKFPADSLKTCTVCLWVIIQVTHDTLSNERRMLLLGHLRQLVGYFCSSDTFTGTFVYQGI